jgi:isocitrate/isopropylmalate dehydrogenase
VIRAEDLDVLEASLKQTATGGTTAGAAVNSTQLHDFDHVYNPQHKDAPGAAGAGHAAPVALWAMRACMRCARLLGRQAFHELLYL